MRAQIAGEPIHKAEHLFGKLLRIEMFAVVPEIKAVCGYVVQRHIFSEGVYSQSSHNVTDWWWGVSKNGKKSVTYFLNGPQPTYYIFEQSA